MKKSKKQQEMEKENELYEFMTDAKRVYHGLPTKYNPEFELNSECIAVLESIPNWDWSVSDED